jgi:methylated-DNA-[protein]-cysteine S-methyltransferase
MKHRRTILPCGFQEEALITAALEEADATLQRAVYTHMHQCQACCEVFEMYRSLNQTLTRLQDTSTLEVSLRQAQDKLAQRLRPKPVVRLRCCRMLSTVGELCIAVSERGIPLVAWPEKATQLLSTLTTQGGVEVQEDGEELHAQVTELHAYLAGTRDHLSWPLDELFIRSPFQRDVLRVTAEIPYGAVMSYQGLADALGRPYAVRAVAQALHRNPLAIVIPCHRVVGRTGHLTGYAGGLERKRALLAHEGIPLVARSAGVFIDRERMYVGWRAERAYCTPHCPSLTAITPGDTLLLSPRALAAQHNFVPCDVCHPEETSVGDTQ